MKRQAFVAEDDKPLFVLKRDLSGGINTRQYSQMIADNQAVLLQNILLETSGQTSIRTGQTIIDSTFPSSSSLNSLYIFDENGIPLLDENGNYLTPE